MLISGYGKEFWQWWQHWWRRWQFWYPTWQGCTLWQDRPMSPMRLPFSHYFSTPLLVSLTKAVRSGSLKRKRLSYLLISFSYLDWFLLSTGLDLILWLPSITSLDPADWLVKLHQETPAWKIVLLCNWFDCIARLSRISDIKVISLSIWSTCIASTAGSQMCWTCL